MENNSISIDAEDGLSYPFHSSCPKDLWSKYLKSFMVFGAIASWFIPSFVVLFHREIISEDIGRTEWWIFPVVVVAVCLTIKTCCWSLPSALGPQYPSLRRTAVVKQVIAVVLISYFPIFQFFSLDRILDTAAPSWGNWSCLFMAMFVSMIVVVEIKDSGLLRDKLRMLSFGLVLYCLLLSPIHKLAYGLGLTQGPYPPMVDNIATLPIPTAFGRLLTALGSLYHVVIFVTIVLAMMPVYRRKFSSRCLPVLFAILTWTHLSSLSTSYFWGSIPYVEVSPTILTYLDDHVPRSYMRWLEERRIIIPKDGERGEYYYRGPLLGGW